MSRWRIPVYSLLALLIVLGAAVYGLWFWPVRDPHPVARSVRGTLVLRDVKLYPSPDESPIEHATIVAKDGLIQAFGTDVPTPPDARLLPCVGCVVTAGFWNTHVHFTQPTWDSAAWTSASALNAALEDMLTSRGFTTVVDLGSDLRNTVSLRRRIASGDLRGPFIYTAGSGLYPPHGVPFYIKENAPSWLLWFIPQPESPAEAATVEERNIARGADVLKLFTGSYVKRGTVLPMPEPIAKAAVEVARRHRQLAFSHPSDLAGTLVAVHSGVDILAHAPDSTEGIDETLLREIVGRRMSMIPTLHMFGFTVTMKDSYLRPIYREVDAFHKLGGELLFGTDVGYMTDYDTSGEFKALAECHLTFQDMLRMLTTSPARRFGVANQKGTIRTGQVADLVALDSDPANDVTALARVRWTVRNGEVIYSSKN